MTYQSALDNLTYTFAPGGLQIAVSTGSGGIGQRLELALETGKSYTLAAQIDGVVYALQITGGTSCNQNVTSTTTLAYVADYGGYNTVRVYFTDATARVITWVALYEGAYIADTLPPYMPKSCTMELAECQRYYQCISVQTHSTAISAGQRAYYVPFSIKMRATPTITLGEVIERDNWTRTNAAFHINWASPDGCRIYAEVPATISPAFWLDVTLRASADL